MNLWNLSLIFVLTTIVEIVKLATISGSTTCSGTNYFDSATLDWQAWSTNYVSSSNNMIWICPAQDYLSGSTQPLTWGTCSSGQAPLFIQTEWASWASADVNSATNCGCSNNRFTSEFGTTSRALRCVDCPVGYYSSANNSPLYNCTVCAAEGQYIVSGSWSWDTKQLQQSFWVDSTTYSSTVSTTYNPTTGAQVVYNPTIGKSGLTTAQVATSDTMTYLLPQALFECINYKYSKQCQILANLWVLQMYKESTPQCSALKNLASASSTLQNSFYNDAGWKQNLPWLYYSSTGDKVIYQSNRVKAKMTLSSSSSDSARYSNIPFKLAKYALDGAFLGWETLSNQIFLCPVAYTDSPNFMKVGHSILKTWQFDLQPLVDRTLALKNLNYFFELFLVDYNGDLIDVPVLIDNFVDSSGTYPNRGSTDESKWRFVRRFFLYENISATEGTGEYLNPTKASTYATFIHESRLVFELDRGGDETIYVPYLHLFYRTITSSLVTTQYPTEVIIVVQWKMSYSHFYDVALGFLIAIHVLVLIWVIWRAYKWILLHPQNYESAFFIFYIGVQLIYETFKIWSTLIFWFLFVCSFVWFVTFKLASAFYVLLPDNYDWVSNYRTPEIIFGCMVSIRIIVIAYEIYLQWSIDIFFLDREQRKDDPAISPNAWRLIFVANEYNEMQMMTYINIELTLFWFVFFIDGLGWDNWSTYNSKLETSQDYSNYNTTLYI